ncbi:hypothetical protein BDV26DRAFT_262844 [Aspergillus bertholletiae]|uniref:Uncharacterized protein n=1 Tax=Aspergillus bertholletiae TaxID=1226010 RepID=A0A5N7B7Y7_9EURO|nr:hypothetical protein BDV26DRAFT_262844 [Aspergillus bertholletiae]
MLMTATPKNRPNRCVFYLSIFIGALVHIPLLDLHITACMLQKLRHSPSNKMVL